MQNRYVGDVGDFGKHGLLRYLSGMTAGDDLDPLKLGVIWYLFHDERHGNDANKVSADGNHTEYLTRTPKYDRAIFRECDSELWEGLRDLVFREARCVHCVEGAGFCQTTPGTSTPCSISQPICVGPPGKKCGSPG